MKAGCHCEEVNSGDAVTSNNALLLKNISIDKNTDYVLATKLLIYEPVTELIYRKDRVEERYDEKTQKWNDNQKKKGNNFLQSLFTTK